jgi:putative ABC transport system permease protein
LTESILVNFLAFVFAAVIVGCLAPLYQNFIGKIDIEGFWTSGLLSEPVFWIALLLILIGQSLLIGIYPAFITTRFNPINVLKGKFYGSLNGILVRKVFVGFQFALAILLIAGSLIVYNQLTYMRKQALGYNKDEVLVIKTPGLYNLEEQEKINFFPLKLLSASAVKDVSLSSEVPGEVVAEKKGARILGEGRHQNTEVAITQIDDHFFKTYQIKLVAGRNFRQEDSVDIFPRDGLTFPDIVPVIINESVAKNLGYMSRVDAVNKLIMFGFGAREFKGVIVGVVKDYHQRSLKDPYESMLYVFPSQTEWRYYSVNLSTKNLERDIFAIRSSYKNLFPANPFEFFFLDDYFNEQYHSDRQFGKVFNAFTGLTIFISFMGLLGLLSFSIRTRLKEVGVRRVLGASAYHIINLFFLGFFKLIILAALIALPLVYFAGSSWLNNFAFHAPLNIVVFILPPAILLVTTFSAVVVQSITVALASPVSYMREE